MYQRPARPRRRSSLLFPTERWPSQAARAPDGAESLGRGDGLDHVGDLGLERGAAHQEAVDVGARREVGRVLGVGRAAVLDADLVGGLLVDILGDPVADGLVGLLSLLGRG